MNKNIIKEIKIQDHNKMNILKLLVSTLLLSAFVHANEGPVGVKAVVKNKNILSGNIVELHIRATGKIALFSAVKKIDGVKVLSQDERITHVHTYSHGKLKKECTIFTLTFAPEKDMTIPSYKVEIDGRIYKTKPIKLKMKDSTTLNKKKSNIFSLKLRSNKKSVMVGEAFLATVYLSLQHNFIISKKLQYHRPKFEGFFVEQIDKGESYNEGDYQITELKYILTPHSEGNFTVGPAYAKIGLQDGSKKVMVNVDKGRKMFQKASNSFELEVFPKAVESDLVGKFSLNAKVDTQKVAAGKPVKLSIKLEGEGDLTRFDFPDYTMDGVTVYSNKAKIDIKMVDAKIHSSYSKEFVFISEESFSIPVRLFSMYDPRSGELKELKIDRVDIETGPSKAVPATSRTSKSQISKEIINKMITLKEKVEVIVTDWWIAILSFLLGGVFFYLFRYLPKRKQTSFKESEALKILYGHISKDPEVEEMVRKLYARKNGGTSVKIDKQKLKELIEHFT